MRSVLPQPGLPYNQRVYGESEESRIKLWKFSSDEIQLPLHLIYVGSEAED